VLYRDGVKVAPSMHADNVSFWLSDQSSMRTLLPCDKRSVLAMCSVMAGADAWKCGLLPALCQRRGHAYGPVIASITRTCSTMARRPFKHRRRVTDPKAWTKTCPAAAASKKKYRVNSRTRGYLQALWADRRHLASARTQMTYSLPRLVGFRSFHFL